MAVEKPSNNLLRSRTQLTWHALEVGDVVPAESLPHLAKKLEKWAELGLRS